MPILPLFQFVGINTLKDPRGAPGSDQEWWRTKRTSCTGGFLRSLVSDSAGIVCCPQTPAVGSSTSQGSRDFRPHLTAKECLLLNSHPVLVPSPKVWDNLAQALKSNPFSWVYRLHYIFCIICPHFSVCARPSRPLLNGDLVLDIHYFLPLLNTAKSLEMAVLAEYTCAILEFHVMPAPERLL